MTRPKRILVCVPTWGGLSQTFVHQEVQALRAQAEVRVMCHQLERLPQPDDPPITIIPFHFSTWRRIRHRLWPYRSWQPQRSAAVARRLNRLIDRFDPQVIHIHFGHELVRVVDNLAPRHRHLRLFACFHGYDASAAIRDPRYVADLRRVFALPTLCATFVSAGLRDQFHRHTGIDPSLSRVAYLGISIARFVRSECPPVEQVFTYLQIGRFVPKKGQLLTIRAFAELLAQHPDTPSRLVFGGDGPQLPACRQLVRTLGLNDHIDFLGAVPNDTVPMWLARAHAYVHHAQTAASGATEGLPIALLEAMAMELPIVSTQHAGIPEVVVSGSNGLLVTPGDVSAFAMAMHRITQFGFLPNNREVVARRHSLDVRVNQLMHLYTHRDE